MALLCLLPAALAIATDSGSIGMGEFVPFADKAGDRDYTSVVFGGIGLLFFVSLFVMWLTNNNPLDELSVSKKPLDIDQLFLKMDLLPLTQNNLVSGVQNSLITKVQKKHVGPQVSGTKQADMPVKSEHVYLRSLTSNRASLITNHGFEKNEQIDLSLSSLPQYPSSNSKIRATVLSCKNLRGDRNSFIVKIKFDDKIPEDLSQYIEQLSCKPSIQ